ncbi:MAG: hypothetical protein JW798_01885 [Prolixibacteraceae bacterium]|nr:hypothetical protein [Prolixibacteraceae bacterium]
MIKKVIITLIAGLMITLAGIAQPPGPGQFDPEEMVKRQTEQMVEDLSLNDDQTKKVEAINRKYGEKTREMFQSAQGNFEGMREKMETIREEKNGELKAVLTEDQYNKYIEIEKKRMEERRNRWREGGQQGQSNGRRGGQRGNGE